MMLMTAFSALSQTEKKLPLCPKSPNCVSSQASDRDHYIAPFKLSKAPELVWSALQNALDSLPRTQIVSTTDNTLHAQTSSRVFGFKDDINAILDVDAKLIHIRSASRTGYGDFGVNRKRIEWLRSELQKAGLSEK